jgi:hypothetical protein
MKIYRVMYHNDNVGDSGVQVQWLRSQSEVRRFIQDELRGDGEVEEYEGHDGTCALPKNLTDIVYHQGLGSSVDDGVYVYGWAVEEVDVPTKSKTDMIDFLNSVADRE